MYKKKFAARLKLFFCYLDILRHTDFFGPSRCRRFLALHDFIFCLNNYKFTRASLLALAKSTNEIRLLYFFFLFVCLYLALALCLLTTSQCKHKDLVEKKDRHGFAIVFSFWEKTRLPPKWRWCSKCEFHPGLLEGVDVQIKSHHK